MITEQQKAELFHKFDTVLGSRMERIFSRAMLGEVTWDHEIWSALLDWIEGPLRRRLLWGDTIPEDKRGEHHPAYLAFENFDRARLQGALDDGQLIRVVFAAVKELQNLMGDGMFFFHVEFKEAEEE